MNDYKLNEFQEKWLTALESGEYQQGLGVLKRKNFSGGFCFCCLGVAEDLNGTPCEMKLGDDAYRFDGGDGSDVFGFLTEETREKLNLYTSNGTINWKYTTDSKFKQDGFLTLTSLNDSGYISFKEIAAFIRANPRAVFKE